MSKIKTILRLHFESKLSQHQIASSLNLSVGVVNKYIQRAVACQVNWPLPDEYQDEEKLRQFLQPVVEKTSVLPTAIDFKTIHQELKHKGVTLQLLWEEHRTSGGHPISYAHFCLRYRTWKNTQPQSMRQTHKAGDKVFVDYAGPGVEIIDPGTGEVRKAQIFVGVLGASNYTFAKATWSQQLPDWLGAHQSMFDFFGGVTALVVPDNLRAGVSKACRYEPDINPVYAEFIEHYGTAVLPARPAKPKDKAKVENAVLVVERWIIARLRHRTFVGLCELNRAIRELLHELNQRPFKKLPGCRQNAFEAVDKPALKPLPRYPYVFAYYKKARVSVDYHIELEGHYYSVPHAFIGKEIDVRFTHATVACWYQGKQIALHSKSPAKGAHTTVTWHMPKSHQKQTHWTSERFLQWAAKVGVATTQLVTHLLENKPHPEQGYRSCLGLLSLSKRVGEVRLEKACARAWALGTKTRRSVASILHHRLEDLALTPSATVNAVLPVDHENLRGKHYYH